jgi:hypothetical protein
MRSRRSIPKFYETRVEHRVIDGRPADVYEAIRYTSAKRKEDPRLVLPVMTAIRGSRLVRAAGLYGAALAFYLLAARPRLLRWGASEEELRRVDRR